MHRSMESACVVARESNVVHVDFGRQPDPPAPRFPGAAGLRANRIEEYAEPVCGRAAGSGQR
jgi:hypothetical protein